MDLEKIQALFAQSRPGDYESEEGRAAVSALRMDGNREIFENAALRCHSDDPVKRARAADIPCQLLRAQSPDMPGSPERMFQDESNKLITNMLEGDHDGFLFREEAAVCPGKRHDQRLLPRLQAMPDSPEITTRWQRPRLNCQS